MNSGLQSLEQRVAVLEKLVNDLRAELTARPGNWLDRLTGSVKDQEAFEEAMRLGREFRRTGRVPDQLDDSDEAL